MKRLGFGSAPLLIAANRCVTLKIRTGKSMSSMPKFFSTNETNENGILNDGLEFTMEFGKNWLQPIQERLL